MEDDQTKKFVTESEPEKPAEVTAATADSSATEKSDEVTTATADSSATEKSDEMTAATADSSTTEKSDEVTAVIPDSSPTKKPVEVTTATPDSSTSEKPVEVTAPRPCSSAAGKPLEVTAVTPNSLAARRSVMIEQTSSDAASEEPSSQMPSDTEEQDSERIVQKTTSRSKRKDSLIVHRSRSMGMIMKWSLSTYFDFNPTYFLQFRGIMNVFHIILGIVIIILLAESCRLYAHDSTVSDGFFCRSPETFMFVTAISGFLLSLLYFFCCLLSKKTEALLFHTSFEVSYFIMYAVLYIIAACSIMMSEESDLKGLIKTSYNYRLSYGSGVLGLINGLFYVVSAVAFFLTHKFHNDRRSLDGGESI